MSIFSSVECPKCEERELSIAIAHSFRKIRLTCDCGYWAEIKVSKNEEDLLVDILEKRKREDDLE